MASRRHQQASRFNIQAWAQSLRWHGHIDQSSLYAVDPIFDYEIFRALGLPTYHSLLIPCRRFLSGFEGFQQKLIFPRYFLSLVPKRPDLPKYSLLDFAKLAIAKQFIHEHVRNTCDQYFVHISEYERNRYGGSIMSDAGIVIAEIAPGNQQQVSQGRVIPDVATLWGLACSTRYSTKDVVVRNLLWRAMMGIRKTGPELLDCLVNGFPVHSLRGFDFLRGYFEFAYTGEHDEAPRLVFFDAKLNSAYTSKLICEGRQPY